ncbi:MAG TPA: RNA polymerase sigma factor [Polyangiaceae bacterium]|nr:RNA polymerase sigma factor [Polyangiaceae bacterium]
MQPAFPRERKLGSATDAEGFSAIYDHHGRFVWLTLQRLGVRRRDLDDLCHDTFVIVHDKLATCTDRTTIRNWLFAICVRVAANYRRRAPIRLEDVVGSLEEVAASGSVLESESISPEGLALQREALAAAHAVLEKIQPIYRVVFVMFEVEGIGCDEIATDLGVALGTVYSRLHAARKSFQREARRVVAPASGGSHG